MIYAFAPLLVMSLVYIFWGIFAKTPPKRAARNLFSASAATATVGMVANGVVIIFGSTNRLIPVYLVLTSLTLIAALICYYADLSAARKTHPVNMG